MNTRAKQTAATVGVYVAWLLLAVVIAVVAWQIHLAVLVLMALLIDSPMRPPGWSSATLVGVSKLSMLVLGSGWLISVMYLEGQLGKAVEEKRLGRFLAQVLGWLGIIGAVGHFIPLLIG
jgi:hypothetical protein